MDILLFIYEVSSSFIHFTRLDYLRNCLIPWIIGYTMGFDTLIGLILLFFGLFYYSSSSLIKLWNEVLFGFKLLFFSLSLLGILVFLFILKIFESLFLLSVSLFSKVIYLRKYLLRSLSGLFYFLLNLVIKLIFKSSLVEISSIFSDIFLWPRPSLLSIGFDITIMLDKIDKCFHDFHGFWTTFSN